MRTACLLIVFSLCPLFTAGCAQEPDGHVGLRSEALADPGPWHIPPSTVAIGDTQNAELTEAGPWVGPSGCHGGYTEGAMALGAYLRASFPGVSGTEGYACRAIVGIPDAMSVHATGRAIDVFIPTIGGEADNDLGDAVGNWLIEHAEEVGIQRVIWDRWTWWSEVPPGYSRSMPYDWEGSHPHNDHLHVELTVAAGNRETAFFSGPMDPPTPAGCAALPAAGGLIDDGDPCFQAYGNPEFWRVVPGRGEGGSSLWTNAWQTDAASNWAHWAVRTGASGDYELSVNTVPEFAVYDDVRYDIHHGGTTTTVHIDQSAADGWRSLGVFRFAGASGEGVSVYDNYDVSVGADQHISVDALRVTWAGGALPPDGGLGPDAAVRPDTDASGPRVEDGGTTSTGDGGVTRTGTEEGHGGCAVAAPGAPSPSPKGLLFVGLLTLTASLRRKRR